METDAEGRPADCNVIRAQAGERLGHLTGSIHGACDSLSRGWKFKPYIWVLRLLKNKIYFKKYQRQQRGRRRKARKKPGRWKHVPLRQELESMSGCCKVQGSPKLDNSLEELMEFSESHYTHGYSLSWRQDTDENLPREESRRVPHSEPSAVPSQ